MVFSTLFFWSIPVTQFRFKAKPSDLHIELALSNMVASNYVGPSRHVSELKRVINVKYIQDVTDLVQKQKSECNLSQSLYFDYMFKWYYRVKQNILLKLILHVSPLIWILKHLYIQFTLYLYWSTNQRAGKHIILSQLVLFQLSSDQERAFCSSESTLNLLMTFKMKWFGMRCFLLEKSQQTRIKTKGSRDAYEYITSKGKNKVLVGKHRISDIELNHMHNTQGTL